MIDLPHGITYAALGALTLTMAGLVVWGIVQRLNKRSQAEGDLDQRLPMILANVTAGWENLNQKQATMIDKAEARADRATEEREALMRQFIDYATVQVKSHADELGKVRQDFTSSLQRLHDRVEATDKNHEACTTKLAEAEKKIAQLEQRQFNAALLTPIAPVVAPAAVPQTITVPAAGLNITPASG